MLRLQATYEYLRRLHTDLVARQPASYFLSLFTHLHIHTVSSVVYAQNDAKSYIARVTNARNFMVTERGYFGQVPAVAEKGDIVARLFGSTSLPPRYIYLLGSTGQLLDYKFIGSGWICGDEFEIQAV